jgi:mannose-6-phosphate isomerase-like protein (cupin superfamily)
MKIHKLSDMSKGWYIGSFYPTCYETEDFEVSYKLHPKGEDWGLHYHEKVKEINLLVRGKMILQGKELFPGDIFILDPYEIADPNFIEDCEIVCVKVPGVVKDKVVVSKC